MNEDGLQNLIASKINTTSDFRDLIKKDVHRTNFISSATEKRELTRLLEEVASNFPKIEYYQGMNCIGGYLISYTGNYKVSLLVFNYLMEKRLNQYFADSFKNLKQLLYVVDKLLELYMSDLANHLRKLGLRSDVYLSMVLFTLFTGAMQYSKEHEALVSDVMDIIIAQGWPGFFKVLMVIFSKFNGHVLTLDYENVIIFFQNKIFKRIQDFDFSNIKVEIDEFRIDRSLLRALHYEYQDTKAGIEGFWREYYEKKKSRYVRKKSRTKRGSG